MNSSDLETDDLRTRLANYRQTRKTAAPSLRRWLDNLIRDAEQRLHELTGLPLSSISAESDRDDADADADDEGIAAATTHTSRRYRNIYPFDETAPPQRPLAP
jgi:hypothetical protein